MDYNTLKEKYLRPCIYTRIRKKRVKAVALERESLIRCEIVQISHLILPFCVFNFFAT